MLELTTLYGQPHEHIEGIGPRLPPGMLPFGTVLMRRNGLLLLQFDGEKAGSIWAWQTIHETWGLGQNTRLAYVAPDFDTMIASIQLFDEDE